jgi:hypothetical protein
VSPEEKAEPEDDVRRKFREALERKQRQSKGPGSTHGDDGTGKSHGKDAQPRREFRRKSG